MQVDIEIAHIYADAELSSEHHESVQRFKNIADIDSTASVLIDDYNSLTPTLDVDKYISDLEDMHDIRISSVVFESTLVKAAEKILETLPNVSAEYFKKQEKFMYFLNAPTNKIALYEKKKDGTIYFKCAILTAAWQLSRLGVFSFDWNRNLMNRYGHRASYPELVVSILDRSYKANEGRSVEIIQNTPYAKMADKIHHEYV